MKYRGDYPISHSIKANLLHSVDKCIFQKFEHEQSSSWKTDQLQLTRLFEVDLAGSDPFFIEGQEEIVLLKKEEEKAKQKENIYTNFVHTEAIEDFEA